MIPPSYYLKVRDSEFPLRYLIASVPRVRDRRKLNRSISENVKLITELWTAYFEATVCPGFLDHVCRSRADVQSWAGVDPFSD